MSSCYELYKFVSKIMKTNISNNITKFLANYLKGRQAFAILQNVSSRKQNLKTEVPQGGVLSSTLFNIYMSDVPKPPKTVQIEVCADNLNTMSSNNKYQIAEQNLQPFLNKIFDWTKENDLQLNASNQHQLSSLLICQNTITNCL